MFQTIAYKIKSSETEHARIYFLYLDQSPYIVQISYRSSQILYILHIACHIKTKLPARFSWSDFWFWNMTEATVLCIVHFGPGMNSYCHFQSLISRSQQFIIISI